MEFHGIQNFGETILREVYASDTTGIFVMDSFGNLGIQIINGGRVGIGQMSAGWEWKVQDISGLAIGRDGRTHLYLYPYTTHDFFMVVDDGKELVLGHDSAPNRIRIDSNGRVGVNVGYGLIDSSVQLHVNGKIRASNGTSPEHLVTKSQLDSIASGATFLTEEPLRMDATSELHLDYNTTEFEVVSGELRIKEISDKIHHGDTYGLLDNDHTQYRLRKGWVSYTTTPGAGQVQNCFTLVVTGNVQLPKCSDVELMHGEITIIRADSTGLIKITPDGNDRIGAKSKGTEVWNPNLDQYEAITLIVIDDTTNDGIWAIKSTAGGMWT